MYDDLPNDVLLDALDKARAPVDAKGFPVPRDEAAMRQMVEELIRREVYPAETVEGNPNSVFTMIEGYGARWHQWSGVLACPHCKTDLRCHRTGPPFKLEIAHYDRGSDRTTGFFCPECKENIHATLLGLENALA